MCCQCAKNISASKSCRWIQQDALSCHYICTIALSPASALVVRFPSRSLIISVDGDDQCIVLIIPVCFIHLGLSWYHGSINISEEFLDYPRSWVSRGFLDRFLDNFWSKLHNKLTPLDTVNAPLGSVNFRKASSRVSHLQICPISNIWPT